MATPTPTEIIDILARAERVLTLVRDLGLKVTGTISIEDILKLATTGKV